MLNFIQCGTLSLVIMKTTMLLPHSLKKKMVTSDLTTLFIFEMVSSPVHTLSLKKVLESVERLPHKAIASISAELITDVHFYQKSAHPVLVKCNWSIRPNATSDFIDASVAVPLMLEQLLRGWHESRYDESWDFMQSFLLGQPHGATSSHFINRQTGTVLRKLYKEIVNTGMYGSY